MKNVESDTAERTYPKWVTLVAGRGREEYLLSLRNPFYLCVMIYLASFIIGYMFSDRLSLSSLEELLSELPQLGEVGPALFMLLIFISNALKTLLWMLLGIVFGVASLFFASLNGFILGLLFHNASDIVNPLYVVLAIAPHGIVEWPMTLLGSAVGVRLGYSLINRLRGEGSLLTELSRGMALFFRRILPLLFLAAATEAFITPLILALFR